MSVNTVTVNNTGEKLGELVFPNKETFKSKNNIASLDANGKLVLSQSPYTAGYGIRINNLGVISAIGGGSGGGDDHNKGWFVTPEQLPATGENGDYAVVGTTNTIWVWNSDTLAWMDSGARSQIESVNGVSPDSSGNVTITSTNIPDIAETYATKTSLDSKQNKLRTYSESDPSGGLPSAAITAEVGLSLDSKQIKIGGGIFNSETIIDGWSKGYAGTSKIKVNGSSISLQTTSSDYEGSSIELTENTLAINSDNGITGNILEKTISSSSVDTKIPTAKAVKDSLDTKQDKLTVGDGIKIENNVISATRKGTVTQVNGVSPDSSGNVTITSTNIPDIAETYATKTSLDSKQDKTDANLITANKTIVGAINEIFNKDNILSATYKTEISTGSTTGLLLMPNGENYIKPEIGQFIDYKIKIFAKSVDNTKFEKYSVNFFAINNNDTSIIISSPTCESVSFAGGPLINNVDVRSKTEDSTKIEFSVTTKSDNVVLYTALNKTIINNII